MAEKQFLTKKGYEERVAQGSQKKGSCTEAQGSKRAGRLIRECRV